MSTRVIELPEYETKPFARDEITEKWADIIHSTYGNQVRIDAPNPWNNSWQLTALGWVGYIPLSQDLHLSLVPKVPIRNLFGMLEYAYRLEGFKILDGLVDSDSIADIYDRLALILAKRVLDRIRKGLYQSYVAEDDDLPYVRGRIDLLAYVRDPSRVNLPCHFEEHTADLEDNQILLWTLTRVLEYGICTDRSLPHVHQAYRALHGFAKTVPFSPQKCVDRLYSRMNEDYEPMHALCRFFLEHTGPTHQAGDRRMLPVLVDMAALFELFVFEWMRRHVLTPYVVRGQVEWKTGEVVSIKIDITIEDTRTGATVLVLDTKYKAPEQPAAADMEQVVAYAVAKNCQRAVLVYPTILSRPIAVSWGPAIRVESLAFRLDGDIEQSGQQFLAQLLPDYRAS
ncbi:MAG: McrC family protein [Verrucomicrobia bacterium]|nr:McrC family protein [Verrucomicrobiota bacterium]MBU4289440.1 McrC family protein [Verrucomicrobiota bacterium]MBU4429321.1 McrC family protein [Verrucomicrobiota bacterium]MBU4497254.1 McrC family protein [Verrucomicrobiota bacterium]MCG2679147.1 McrC family protein [Kiritimatiellia bacterium]